MWGSLARVAFSVLAQTLVKWCLAWWRSLPDGRR